MMPGQKRYTVKSLQMSALWVVVRRLHWWETRHAGLTSEDLMRIIVDFRSVADPIIRLLVEYTSFLNPQTLCALLVSEFVKKKKVKLYGPHATQIVDLIVDFELFDSISLQTVVELCIERKPFYKREKLFSKFPNLQKLRIQGGLTDKTLKSIAKHFPELTVFDASRDCSFKITDHGLLQLARLKKLRYVIFHPDYDETKCKTPTGKGLALLVMHLPELVKVTFAGFILCDALNYLKLSKSLLLTVKSLDFGTSYIDIDNFIAAGYVCPNLERLRIYVSTPERGLTTEEHLSFRRLTELRVNETLRLWEAPDNFGFKSVWRQLVVLYLDLFSLGLNHMLAVSGNCPNVKFLSFGGDCLDETLSLQDCLSPTWPLLFPRLHTLEFFSGDLRNLYILMHKSSNLVKVSITGFADHVDVLESFKADHGFWPKVKIMSITIMDSNDQEAEDEDDVLSRHLVEAFPSLNQIFVCIEMDEEGIVLTSSQGKDVALCSNVTFKLFSKDPELDYLDCLEME